MKFSLSHNLKINKKMYSNDISRFSDDLGILSKPGMSTSVSIVTCLNFILVVIALAFITSIYCRMMLLVRTEMVNGQVVFYFTVYKYVHFSYCYNF